MEYNVSMKRLMKMLFFGIFTIPLVGFSQYTDVINSNRPGLSVSAYAIGTNVLQAEFGVAYEQQDHTRLATESNIFGADLSLRYGILFETLELNYEGTFDNQNKTYINTGVEIKNTDFSRNRIGLKYLIYDPFKNPENNKPNLYSWKANYGFKLKNLIPAISVYAGANFVLGDNPFYSGDPIVSPRVMVATQSRLTPRFVLISNIAYDRLGTDFPEWNYTVSLSHAFRDPKWSVFVENQGIKSDRYSDVLLRGGVAHLLGENMQVDMNLGASFKNTPSRIFAAMGFSYRIDMHRDKVKAIEDQDAGENGGPIGKNAMKKKKKGKNKGSGAEDIDLGPTKKQLRKLKKKQKNRDDSDIDF
ncbi:transporter [Arenibacter arenosicollis]